MQETVPFPKKFAIGYFFAGPGKFLELIRPHLASILEIYFPFPGILSARELRDSTDEQLRARLFPDLREFRRLGLKLDLLINATCYGEKSYSTEWRIAIERAIAMLDEEGVKPEIVTTTSPFVATVLKRKHPDIEIRASVNLKIGSTLAMEYVSDLYDSFYMSRDLQRDIPTLRRFSEWCAQHGKKLCMLANSGCLRNCPGQIFHETLLAHGFWRIGQETALLKKGPLLCRNIFSSSANFEEILRATWIRPEDLHLYAPYVSAFKLSTRDLSGDAKPILDAYCSGRFDGDLLTILDPNFSEDFGPKMIDNSAFPSDWAESGTAGLCAINCTHCGKCSAVLERVLKDNPNYKPKKNDFSFKLDYSAPGQYSFTF